MKQSSCSPSKKRHCQWWQRTRGSRSKFLVEASISSPSRSATWRTHCCSRCCRILLTQGKSLSSLRTRLTTSVTKRLLRRTAAFNECPKRSFPISTATRFMKTGATECRCNRWSRSAHRSICEAWAAGAKFLHLTRIRSFPCGGLIVIATGWSLLKQRDDEKADVQETVQPQDITRRAFYPLTLPLTVGPASISATITLGANAAQNHLYHPLTILAALIGLALIAISILLCYGFADRLARILRATG